MTRTVSATRLGEKNRYSTRLTQQRGSEARPQFTVTVGRGPVTVRHRGPAGTRSAPRPDGFRWRRSE
eukprot:762460-Hanusia_phi.AAC.4